MLRSSPAIQMFRQLRALWQALRAVPLPPAPWLIGSEVVTR